MAQDFDPVEVLVQSGSSCCGMMSSAALIFAAMQAPSHLSIKMYGGAAAGILTLCLVCCLSANQLPGQG